MSPFNHRQRNFKNEQRHRGYLPLKPHVEKILIVVKTIPHPSVKHRETVCTAGITESGRWIRLYPIGFRYMGSFKRFKKYQWVKVEVEKNKDDNRVDSYRPDLKTLEVLSKPLPAGEWIERKRIVLPTVSPNLEIIKRNYETRKVSLGVFKPKEIIDLVIEPDDSDWSSRQRQILTQLVLFGQQPKKLERIPYVFSYKFVCNHPRCKSHKMRIIDWEIYELYRSVKNDYPYSIDVVLGKVKQQWLDKMWGKDRESYLIVGSVHPFPSFVVLGVFWPPIIQGIKH